MRLIAAGGARSLLTNIFSTAAARAWQAAVQFFVIPLYIMLLGPDAYGLVVFNVTILTTLSFLDQFVSAALIREFGRKAQEDPARSRNLLRSFEFIGLGSGALIGVAILASAPLVAAHWLNSRQLTQDEVTIAVMLMGVSIACQWPAFLYGAGFLGLHRQDLYGAVRVVISTLSAVGGVLLLWLVAPRIDLLLAWQAACSLLQSIVLNRLLWRIMPHAATPARFDSAILRSVWRFAAGSMIASLVATLLVQGDKLIVSKAVSLEQFSAYGLAFFVVTTVYYLTTHSILSPLLPHFSRLWEIGDQAVVRTQYHRWTQLVVVALLPVLGMMIFFPLPLLRLWLGVESPLAVPVGALLPFVAVGSVFTTMLGMPYVLQVSAGWTRLSVIKNAVSLALFLPAVYVGVRLYGPLAGAVCWAVLGLGQFLIEPLLMHRRLLRGELWSWWGRDTLLPLAVAGALFYILSRSVPDGRGLALAYIALCGALVAAILVAILPHARAEAKLRARQLAGLFERHGAV